MDSITQAALGAAVAHAAWHKPLGRKAFLWGAFFGTLPDLDVVFFPLLDDVQQLYWHRGESHSIFFVLIGGALLGALLCSARWKIKISPQRAMAGMVLILATHVLIDYFNSYGTQLLAPFSRFGFSLGNLFIIDPLYTGPLLLGIIAAAFSRSGHGYRFTWAGLAVSSAYILFSLVSHAYADSVFSRQLEAKQIGVKASYTGATPMNTLLWRHVALTDSGILIGYFSVVADSGEEEIEFVTVQRNEALIAPYRGQRNVEAVDWFSNGFWVAEEIDGVITMADLRFGELRTDPNDPPEKWQYIFAWEIPDDSDSLPQRSVSLKESRKAIDTLWARLTGDTRERSKF
ncbi:metal-dependent hydrolase [Prosthecochloris sp.]|uniref:metal-dependent hydrolase n=1 Tax=Prosthecochloris sp. TaxID=290513 RepID=UPI0025ED84F2|nr:metal-dependent hydrolase [Prosthecochloris sp.]